jgi:hypothetical protein
MNKEFLKKKESYNSSPESDVYDDEIHLQYDVNLRCDDVQLTMMKTTNNKTIFLLDLNNLKTSIDHQPQTLTFPKVGLFPPVPTVAEVT